MPPMEATEAVDRRTPKHRLLDVLMRQAKNMDLATYIAARKEAGDPHRTITRKVIELTGEDVTEQSLMNWGVL